MQEEQQVVKEMSTDKKPETRTAELDRTLEARIGKASHEGEAKSDDWRKEFIQIIRRPRPGRQRLFRLVRESLNARVVLKQRREHTDLIVTFPTSFHQLPERFQRAYLQPGINLEEVFSEVIWENPPKGSSTLGADLLRLSYTAYRGMWLRLLDLLYLGHFHPEADKQLTGQLQKLERYTALKSGRRSRRDRESLSRCFKALFTQTTKIHNIVQNGARGGFSKAEIRKSVFREIHGSRIDDCVLRKKYSAFEVIPYGKRGIPVCLENTSSWHPRQLAIAVLALACEVKYKTIERKLARAQIQESSSPRRK